jgi:EAL domain-containing protein (putative c-di-GMP-specific phosphodiesterase class I)/GGDEF domain-containing protein
MLSARQRHAILCTAVSDRILARLFLAPRPMERALVALGAATMLVLGAALVYVTGGTKEPYLHVLYIPIFLVALFFGPWGGLVAGLVAGVLIGPWMPLDVAARIPQETYGWAFRAGIFTLAGCVVGAVVSALRDSTTTTVLHGYIDEFTGLPNRQHLSRELARTGREGVGALVLAVNLRALRPIALVFGVQTAETVLRKATERLTRAMSPDDVLFRVDGSLLAVLDRSRESGEALAERLSECLSKPVEVDSIPLTLDAVVGVAKVDPADNPPDLPLRRAALASDDAAEGGRPWSTFARESDEVLRQRLLLLGDVRTALDLGQMTLYYQPKVRLSDGVMAGCEALVRWRHPTRGELPPGRFVPIVEYSPLIGQLTQCIFNAAVAQVAQWSAQGDRFVVSINMSARDLAMPELVDTIVRMIDTYDVPHSLIDVEITESAAFLNQTDLEHHLGRLRGAGFTLSIDDYGTGMSSLSYLKRIPARYVKIDQMFVRNLATSREDRVLVESTVQMCRRMGLVTVAEGVENAAIADILAALGCDLGQGYHFAPPLPPDALIAYWRDHRVSGPAA